MVEYNKILYLSYAFFNKKEDENLEGGACGVISIREDFEVLKETRKDILGKLQDVEIQNKQIQEHITDVQAYIRFHEIEKRMSACKIRLDALTHKLECETIASYNGILVWKIRDYNRRRQECDHRINSQPFYSSSFGYKMCGRVYLNGDGMGQGTHMSFYIVIMKGEYDALLPWPFKQDVTLTLVDQDTRTQNLSDTFKPDPESSSFKKPATDMNIASGCPLFVPHSVLETPTYLQDDTIYLKIKVDCDNVTCEGAASSSQEPVPDVEDVEEGL